MKTWARILAVVLAALLACAAFGGCGKKKKTDGTGSAASGESQAEGTSSQAVDNSNAGGAASGTASKGSSSKADAEEDNGKTVKLNFWMGYGSSSNNGVAMQQLINKFNTGQSKYYINMSFQGATGELRTKLMSYSQEKLPSIFNGTPITIAQYAETNYTMPIQTYLDADPDNWENDMFAQVRASYSDRHGKLVGIPIGVSIIGYGVNLDVLKKLGKTIDDCTSLETMVPMAIKAVEEGYVKYGFAFNQGQTLHDYLEIEGVDLADNNDGYSGKPTKSLINSGETKKAIQKFLDLNARLYKTTGPNGAKGAFSIGNGLGYAVVGDFKAGNLLFWNNTNSYFDKGLKVSFDWAFLPLTGITDGAKYRNQCISEGTGLFIGNTGKKSEMQGAYEFLKFCAKAENQEIWCTNTSYVPYTNAAAKSAKIAAWQKENFPTASVVTDTLARSSKNLNACYAPTGSELIMSLFQIMSNVCENPNGNFDSYIKEADQRFQQAITVYARKTK